MDRFVVAGVQQRLRLPRTLDELRELQRRFLRAAQAKNARLIVFPELAGLMVAPPMLAKLDVAYVIVGHSERRQYFGETDETVNLKVKAVQAAGMIPIMCCGETLEQRESGKTAEVVAAQMAAVLDRVGVAALANAVVAYEPVWAIGTGKTASNAEANEACGWVRETIGEMYGPEAAEGVRIQYGGSVKPDNIGALMLRENVDGALVGGASLVAEDFIKIINYYK